MNKEDYLVEEFIADMNKKYFRERKLEMYNREKVAVLGIDLQRAFLDPSFHAYLPSSQRFLSFLQDFYHNIKGQIPIIFTRHCHAHPELMARWWHSDMPCNTPETEIHPKLEYVSDAIIEKRTYNAFYHTELDQILRAKDITTLIITGVMTHLCCETTARDAFVRGYKVIYPIDGTLTQNAELHECSVRVIAHGFGVTPTLSYIESWLSGRV